MTSIRGGVFTPGTDDTGRCFERHPDTGVMIRGFQIPNWVELLHFTEEAAMHYPMKYVGWDIALTPEGPALIEGNVHWPGGNIIQFDRVGKYPLILSCLGEKDEKHTD